MILLVDYGEIITFLAMAIASVIAIAVGSERTILFRANAAEKNDTFLESVIGLIRKKDLTGVVNAVNSHTENIYTRFTAFAMEHYSKGADSLGKMMEGMILKERIQLEKRLPILNTLGNNAPFIGLLGTVLGVIKAFYNLGTLGNTGAEIVMKSISTALLATAAGLMIAIPVVMVNNYFSKKLKVIDQNLEILSKEILASITSVQKDEAPVKKTAPKPKPVKEKTSENPETEDTAEIQN